MVDAEIIKFSTLMLTVLVIGIVNAANDFLANKKARERVHEAEKEAFKVTSDTSILNKGTSKETGNQAPTVLQIGNLFDLYHKQIEKYQTETQSRANSSFIFAIVSMVAGIGFVFWGSTQILTNVAAATIISGIGGAVGAYITKTFLDVHRLSLNQLNHYFKQPVLNAHILNAQRIADQITDESSRQKAYEQILTSVVALIGESATSYTKTVSDSTHQSDDTSKT